MREKTDEALLATLEEPVTGGRADVRAEVLRRMGAKRRAVDMLWRRAEAVRQDLPGSGGAERRELRAKLALIEECARAAAEVT